MKLLYFYSVVTCQEYYFISGTERERPAAAEHGQIFIIITHKSAALSNLFPCDCSAALLGPFFTPELAQEKIGSAAPRHGGKCRMHFLDRVLKNSNFLATSQLLPTKFDENLIFVL
jgi:hypothetical protein